jgi:hypothetical protein
MPDIYVKSRYDLQFIYVDNDQVYSEYLLLTEREKDILFEALEVLVKVGEIRSPDGDPGTDNMLVPYSEPSFRPFSELKSNWAEGSLQVYLDDQKFKWPKK